MSPYEAFLFPVFDYLRRYGTPLGISDYLLAIKTLRSDDFVLSDDAHFKRFCSLLWTKSKEDQALLDKVFELEVEPELKRKAAIKTEPLPKEMPSVHESGKSKDKPSSKSIQLDQMVYKEQSSQSQIKKFDNRDMSSLHDSFRKTSFHLIPRLPLSKRVMTTAFRHLRHRKRTGPPQDLDVEQTIQSIGHTGFLLKPVLVPRRRNVMELLLLIDCKGSMAPFSIVIQALKDSIVRGGFLVGSQPIIFTIALMRNLSIQMRV
jgi:uncharacterized protein with von Willebrand factor type A (vWA) domain